MKTITFVTLLIFLIGTINTHAQIPNCPLRVGNAEVYSSSSVLGDKICPLLNSASVFTTSLGSTVTNKLNEVKADMEQFKNVTLQGAINEDAVEKFNSSIVQLKAITTDLTGFLKDAECGVPGAMDALKNKFLQSIKAVSDLAEITVAFGDALKKLAPVLPEVINIGNKVVEISTSVNNQTPEMKNHFTKLSKAIETIEKDLGKLMKNDPVKLITTGSTIVTGVVPYLGECAACATTLVTSISGLSTAAAGAGGGTATSETGVGAIVGGSATIVGLVASATSSALSSIPCTAVFEKSNQVMKYIKDIEGFVNAISSTSESISKKAEAIIEASEAINEIGKTLSQENKPKLQAIHSSLIAIANTLSDAATVIQNTVLPKVNTLLGNRVQQISNDVLQLQYCYNKLGGTFGYMTNNLKEGILDFVPAVTQMVDAEQIITNLSAQLVNAKNSAEASMRTNWNTLNERRVTFSNALLGNQPTDLGKVALHLAGLITRVDELVQTGANLSSSIASMVTNAINTGKQGFLTNINTNKSNAEAAYTSISSKAKALKISIAKEKAASAAKAKARELIYNNSKAIAIQILPALTVKPLINAIQLKTKMLQ
jgi:hypothetical protein